VDKIDRRLHRRSLDLSRLREAVEEGGMGDAEARGLYEGIVRQLGPVDRELGRVSESLATVAGKVAEIPVPQKPTEEVVADAEEGPHARSSRRRIRDTESNDAEDVGIAVVTAATPDTGKPEVAVEAAHAPVKASVVKKEVILTEAAEEKSGDGVVIFSGLLAASLCAMFVFAVRGVRAPKPKEAVSPSPANEAFSS
jgi:hypothetical protein